MSLFPTYHLSLYVSNLNASLAFYDKFWAVPAHKVKPGYAKWEIPGMVFSIVENPEKVESNFGHMGIRVENENDLKFQLDRFKNSGFKIKEEMGTHCCYAKQDKFWVVDPDNYHWEYYLFHGDVEFNDPHYASEASECCSPSIKTEEVVQPFKTFAQPKNTCEPGSGCC